jgi:hypothetical protein
LTEKEKIGLDRIPPGGFLTADASFFFLRRPHLRKKDRRRYSKCRRGREIGSFADKQCRVGTWSEVGGCFSANAAGRMRPRAGEDGRVGMRKSVQGWFAANAARERMPGEDTDRMPGGGAEAGSRKRGTGSTEQEQGAEAGSRKQGTGAGNRSRERSREQEQGKGAVSGFLRRCRDFLLF